MTVTTPSLAIPCSFLATQHPDIHRKVTLLTRTRARCAEKLPSNGHLHLKLYVVHDRFRVADYLRLALRACVFQRLNQPCQVSGTIVRARRYYQPIPYPKNNTRSVTRIRWRM
jgi:hypothetical protein